MTELEKKNNLILSDYMAHLENDVMPIIMPIIEKLDLDAFSEMISVYGIQELKATISDRIKYGEFDLVKFVNEYKVGKHI